MSAGIGLDHVSVKFGQFTAVDSATLDIEPGEFFSFLGPSGCGKTTILRTVSGFLEPSSGRVLIGGEDMAGKGPNQRPTALIFQNLALFPLMSVAENITYGLRVRGASKTERMKKADELQARDRLYETKSSLELALNQLYQKLKCLERRVLKKLIWLPRISRLTEKTENLKT